MRLRFGRTRRMAKLLRFAVVAWLGIFLPPVAAAASTGYALTNAFPGLTFTNPVCIASPPGETNRLFIVERKGRIAIITNLAAPTRTLFMDISGRVANSADTTVGGEEGLLGLAFHPGYATNGFFYVFYTHFSHDSNIVARFTASPPSTNVVNIATRSEVISFTHTNQNNHNGGCIQFGPDGDLYIATGDGGG